MCCSLGDFVSQARASAISSTNMYSPPAENGESSPTRPGPYDWLSRYVSYEYAPVRLGETWTNCALIPVANCQSAHDALARPTNNTAFAATCTSRRRRVR